MTEAEKKVAEAYELHDSYIGAVKEILENVGEELADFSVDEDMTTDWIENIQDNIHKTSECLRHLSHCHKTKCEEFLKGIRET